MKKQDIIALIGALAFITWLPFYFGVVKVNAASPLAQAVSKIPIIGSILIQIGEFEGLLMFAVFMLIVCICFVWAIKRSSR